MTVQRRMVIGCCCTFLFASVCLLASCFKCDRPITTVPHQYPLTYDFEETLRQMPELGADIAHAHVAQWCGSHTIRRMPGNREGVYLFGSDTHFKIEASFSKQLPDSTVAIRECVEKGTTFRPDNNWFMQFRWPSAYLHNASLLLFNENDQLMNVALLGSKKLWRIGDGNSELPIAVFLRRRYKLLTLVNEAPFEVVLQTIPPDNIGIKITIVNRNKKELWLYWPDNVNELLASQDVFFDTFNNEMDLWEHYKKPTVREAIQKEDFRLFQPAESASFTIPRLTDYYSPDIAGAYSVRLVLHILATGYTVPGDGNEMDSVQGVAVDAWTGYLMSDIIKYELPATGTEKDANK